MNFCPNCGAKTAAPDAQFCSNCGFRMPDAPAAGSEPLFQAAVGPEEPAAPVNAPAPTGQPAQQAAPQVFTQLPDPAPLAPPAPPPAAPAGQSMPAARQEDLLDLLAEAQGEAPPAQPRMPANVLPQQPAEAAPAPLFEAPAEPPAPQAEPPVAEPAPAPGLFGGEAAPETTPAADLFGGEAAPAAEPLPDLFGEAAAAPAPTGQPLAAPSADLFGGQAAQEAPPAADLFSEAPATPGLFAEAAPEAAPAEAFAQPAAAQPPQPEAPPPQAPAYGQQVYQPQNSGASLFDAAPAAADIPQQQYGQSTQEIRQQQWDALQIPADELQQEHQQQQWQDPWQQEQARQQAQAYGQQPAAPAPRGGRDGGKSKAPSRAQRDDRAGRAGRGEAQNPYGEGDTSEAMPAQQRRGEAPARQRRTPPPVALPQPEPRRKTRSLAGNILMFFFIVILFAALVGGAVLVMLYMGNRPSKVVDDFTTAVAAGDVEALGEMVKLEGTTASDDGWAAFLAAFSKQTNLNTLKAQLVMQADEADAGTPSTYPAVTIESRPFILFIEKYTITIHGVELLAPGAESGSVARLGETDHLGTSTGEGELYAGLMPGLYSCRIVPPGAEAGSVEPVEVLMFELDAPNVLGAEAAKADITIENVLGSVSDVYINDLPVEDRPQGETLFLSNVSVGSTIRIATTREDKAMRASVVFSDINTTTLRFEDYTEEGGAEPDDSQEEEEDSPALETAKGLTESTINDVLVTFYKSYLDCINDQKIDGIRLATDSGKTAFAERIGSSGNKANTFEYAEAKCDAATIEPADKDGVPTVTVTASFKYRYKPREDEGDWEDGSNKQKVELVYQGDQWLVNKMEFIE